MEEPCSLHLRILNPTRHNSLLSPPSPHRICRLERSSTRDDDYVLARPLIYKIAVEVRVPKHSKFHVFASPARFSRKIRSKGRCEWACRMLRIDGVGCNARTMMCKNGNTAVRCLMRQGCHLAVEPRQVILVYLTVLRDVPASSM